MSAAVLYMSMSLDGFVAGPNQSVDNGLGDGGERLHEWIFAGTPTGHGGVPGRYRPLRSRCAHPGQQHGRR